MNLRRNVMAIGLIAGLATLTPSGSAPLADDSDHPIKIREVRKVRVVNSDQDGNRHEAVHYMFGGSGAFLGVHIEDDDADRAGALIDHVMEGTAAERAGLRDGDLIVGLDDRSIDSPSDLTGRLRELEPGTRVDLKVERDGRIQTLSVELGEREGARAFNFELGDIEGFDAESFGEHMRELTEQLGSGLAFEWDQSEGFDAESFGEHMRELGEQLGEDFDAEELNERMQELGERLGDMKLDLDLSNLEELQRFSFPGQRPRLGVEPVATTPELREHLGGSGEAGVLVGKVLPGTPAETAGLRVGDLIVAVDGEPIESVTDLIDALSERAGETIEVRLIRDRRDLRLEVELEAEEDRPAGDRGQRGSGRNLGYGAAAKNDAVREAYAAARSAALAAQEAAADQAAAANELRRQYQESLRQPADLSETY